MCAREGESERERQREEETEHTHTHTPLLLFLHLTSGLRLLCPTSNPCPAAPATLLPLPTLPPLDHDTSVHRHQITKYKAVVFSTSCFCFFCPFALLPLPRLSVCCAASPFAPLTLPLLSLSLCHRHASPWLVL